MSNFNNFNNFSATTVKTVITNTIRISLNLSKKQSSKDTILGYTHNGVIYNNTKDDTSFINFRLVSQKQGAVKMDVYDVKGNKTAIDASKFLNHLFDGEAPDVKFTADLGATDVLEDAIENGARCLILDVPFDQLQPNGMNDRGWMNFRLGRVSVSFSGEVIGRHSVDINWVMNALSNSVVTELCGREYLSRFRRVTPTPGTDMANKVAPVKTKVEAAVKASTPKVDSDGFASVGTTSKASQDAVAAAQAKYFAEVAPKPEVATVVEEEVETDASPEAVNSFLATLKANSPSTPVVEETVAATEQPEDWGDMDEEEEPANEFDVDAFVASEDVAPEASDQNAVDILAALMQSRVVDKDNQIDL